jgi:hypothetical protein
MVWQVSQEVLDNNIKACEAQGCDSYACQPWM